MFLLYQLSLSTESTQMSWISPRSTLSATEPVRWKSSFPKKRPPDVGNISTGRPNWPNQRNSIGRPSDPLHQLSYCRNISISLRCRTRGDSIRYGPFHRGARHGSAASGSPEIAASRIVMRARTTRPCDSILQELLNMAKKRIGLLFGMEDTFPWALINSINARSGGEIEASAV